MDMLVNALVGYFTPALVSLAARKSWGTSIRFACAVGIAVAAAAVLCAVRSDWSMLDETVGAIFVAQQVTWNLRLPGAGSPTVNDRLLSIGSSVAADVNLDAAVELDADD